MGAVVRYDDVAGNNLNRGLARCLVSGGPECSSQNLHAPTEYCSVWGRTTQRLALPADFVRYMGGGLIPAFEIRQAIPALRASIRYPANHAGLQRTLERLLAYARPEGFSFTHRPSRYEEYVSLGDPVLSATLNEMLLLVQNTKSKHSTSQRADDHAATGSGKETSLVDYTSLSAAVLHYSKLVAALTHLVELGSSHVFRIQDLEMRYNVAYMPVTVLTQQNALGILSDNTNPDRRNVMSLLFQYAPDIFDHVLSGKQARGEPFPTSRAQEVHNAIMVGSYNTTNFTGARSFRYEPMNYCIGESARLVGMDPSSLQQEFQSFAASRSASSGLQGGEKQSAPAPQGMPQVPQSFGPQGMPQAPQSSVLMSGAAYESLFSRLPTSQQLAPESGKSLQSPPAPPQSQMYFTAQDLPYKVAPGALLSAQELYQMRKEQEFLRQQQESAFPFVQGGQRILEQAQTAQSPSISMPRTTASVSPAMLPSAYESRAVSEQSYSPALTLQQQAMVEKYEKELGLQDKIRVHVETFKNALEVQLDNLKYEGTALAGQLTKSMVESRQAVLAEHSAKLAEVSESEQGRAQEILSQQREEFAQMNKRLSEIGKMLPGDQGALLADYQQQFKDKIDLRTQLDDKLRENARLQEQLDFARQENDQVRDDFARLDQKTRSMIERTGQQSVGRLKELESELLSRKERQKVVLTQIIEDVSGPIRSFQAFTAMAAAPLDFYTVEPNTTFEKHNQALAELSLPQLAESAPALQAMYIQDLPAEPEDRRKHFFAKLMQHQEEAQSELLRKFKDMLNNMIEGQSNQN